MCVIRIRTLKLSSGKLVNLILPMSKVFTLGMFAKISFGITGIELSDKLK